MDWEAWCVGVHGVAKTRTRLSDWTELYWTPQDNCSIQYLGLLYSYQVPLLESLTPPSQLCLDYKSAGMTWSYTLPHWVTPGRRRLAVAWKHSAMCQTESGCEALTSFTKGTSLSHFLGSYDPIYLSSFSSHGSFFLRTHFKLHQQKRMTTLREDSWQSSV